MSEDPVFQSNNAKFHGVNKSERSSKGSFYANYNAFFEGTNQSPSAPGTKHMAPVFQEQQNKLLRNRLSENAKRIMGTESFE